MQLLRRSSPDTFIYSTALELDATALGIDCETDIAVLGGKNVDDKVTMAVGECKTNQEISDHDIDNLLRVKSALDSQNVATYLLFTKTGNFMTEEVNRFKALVARNIYPILFTEQDLEPYEPYEYYRNIGLTLPSPRAHDFEGMAQNSHFIYLR